MLNLSFITKDALELAARRYAEKETAKHPEKSSRELVAATARVAFIAGYLKSLEEIKSALERTENGTSEKSSA